VRREQRGHHRDERGDQDGENERVGDDPLKKLNGRVGEARFTAAPEGEALAGFMSVSL
jgi:hypothetical protein